MTIRATTFLLALHLTATGFAQPQGTAAGSEAALAALHTLVSNLEKCQEKFVLERRWGKGRLETERVYVSPPQKVVWRTAQGKGGPSPVAYIEFSSFVYYRVPIESARKYRRYQVAIPADIPVTPDGIAFLPTVDGFPAPDTLYQYEFDLRPEGLSLIRLLSRSSPVGEWEAAHTGHPCGPQPK